MNDFQNESLPILTPKASAYSPEIGSLLPSDLVAEIGYSPNDILNKNDKLILNQPYRSIKRVPRTRTLVDPQPMLEQQNPNEIMSKEKPTSSLNCFEVKLSNCTVIAFSIYEHQKQFGCGVIVRDGAYLRYGQIIKQIPQDECRVSAYQIIEFDENNRLGDYLNEQTEIAKSLVSSYISSKKLSIELKEVETVSFGSRTVIRLLITNSNEQLNEDLTRFLISVFAVAVEIFE